MKMIKVRFLHDDPCSCTTTFKEVDAEKYYNRTDDGGWYTVYPSNGYWECCDPVKGDISFEALDSCGNILFTENVDELGVFVPMKRKIKEIAAEIAEKAGLVSYEHWKNWLLKEKDAHGYDGYIDNWLYAESQNVPALEMNEVNGHPIEDFSYLGIDFTIRAESLGHKICGKKWIDVRIYEKKYGTCAEICGFVL